jgi:hypothetical protein
MRYLRAGLPKLPTYGGTWIFIATGQNRTVINSIRAYLAEFGATSLFRGRQQPSALANGHRALKPANVSDPELSHLPTAAATYNLVLVSG